jgi:ribosomal protein S27E
MKNKQQLTEPTMKQPEWMRLPGPLERCPISALSRSALLDLGAAVPGLITRLRKAHSLRGSVLVHVPTLRSYLESIRQQQIQQPVPKVKKVTQVVPSLAAAAKHEFKCVECGHTTVLTYQDCWGKIIRCAECSAIVADNRRTPPPQST